MESIRAYFGSKYRLVGVKLFKEIPEGYPTPEKPGKFCEFVRRAALGEVILMREQDEECHQSLIALGFQEPRFVDLQPRIQPAETKAVLIAPVEEVKEPDVVLMIANPRQVMEAAALLHGIEAKFAGEIAVCGEVIAQPIKTGKANVTFLCGGARMFADYKDSEVILGAPPEVFRELEARVKALEKSCGALCGCRTSDLPQHVVQVFSELGFERGIDYFFGRVDSQNVRIYLNKDTEGRVRYITVHLPVKGEVEPPPGLEARRRGAWTDLYATFKDGEGFEISTGRGIRELIQELVRKVKQS
ncbi:MAG: DUF169 domain-containing protein [Euryarchaeota archaeon]|nr:DUF169 domain-containing protein [Euryarchaeota archaeon]